MPSFPGTILKRDLISFHSYIWSLDFTGFGLWNVLSGRSHCHPKVKTLQCDVLRAGSSWMSWCPCSLAPMLRLKVSLPAVFVSLPWFPTQPSLSALGWPLADLSLPQTPCSQWKGLSPILQKCLLGAKAFQHPPFQGGQECERATRVFLSLNAPGPVLCTC